MNLSKVLAAFGGVFGINQRISIYPNFGSQILGLLLVFQFGIVGWHYVKQTFGTMMTYSYYDSYELSGGQRNLIKWSLYGIWWVFFLKANEGLKSFTTWGMTYYSLDLPPILTLFAQIYLVITLVLTLTLVFFMNWWRNGKFPTPAVIVPFVAMYIWFPAWDALFISDYFALVVPCAHSLQYLCFVYKVERESKKDFSSRKLFWLASWLILSIVIGGFIIIEVLPSYLDDYVLSKGLMTAGFFTASVQIFINVHHYFIDNAIWQSKNKEIKGHLFS